MSGDFTLIDVLRDRGIEPHKSFSWTLGAILRDRYREMVGDLPVKALRTKTIGIGSHCFATYPPEFRPTAEALVNEYFAMLAAQLDLFSARGPR